MSTKSKIKLDSAEKHPHKKQNTPRLMIKAGRILLPDGICHTKEPLHKQGLRPRRKGFEPLTFWSVARHSIQLS